MKKLIILCALFIVGNTAMAQDMAAAQARAEQKTEAMKSSLSLTAEQTEKVKNLLTGVEQKIEAANSNSNFSAEQKAEQNKMNKEVENQQLKGILSESQYNQYETSQKTTPATESQKSSKANINTSRSTIKGTDNK